MISGEPALEASKVINNEIQSKAEKIEQQIEDLVRKHEKEIAKAADDGVSLQEVLKNVKVETDGFIATAMKIEFGASISDILMKGPDVGLHAGNVLLGSPDKGDKTDKSAQINSIKTLLNMAEGKLKIQTIDKKMKEFELSQLEKLKTAGGQVDDKAITALKAEVSELEEQVAHSQANVGRVEEEINNLQKD
jgi:molecular chaperone GrpE (heat shock protein)